MLPIQFPIVRLHFFCVWYLEEDGGGAEENNGRYILRIRPIKMDIDSCGKKVFHVSSRIIHGGTPCMHCQPDA